MGLCSDRKRGLTPLCFFKKNQNHQNSTMFDKSVSVFPTASGCSAGILNHKETKPHPLFPQTASFHSKSRFTLETLLVGGFLGSKSQGPSANTPPIVWDLICQASSMFQAAMMPLTSGKQCDFISVQSPPKKKFAKEENPSSLEKVDTIEFPSVIQEQSSAVEVPKQSYAEVAKAPSCKPFRPDRCASSKDNTTSRRASGNNRRRSQAGQRRSSRRKTSRQDSRECSSQQTTEVISSSSSPGCHLESWKDPQLIQLEKNFSQFNRVSGKNFKLGERHSKPSSNSHRKDFKSESNSESHNRRRRHPNYRSHCDNKRGTQAKKFDCDIDMINWRTGEPIGSKMGSQHVSDTKGENFSNQYTVCDGVTSLHENVDDCTGAIRKHDFSPCDSVGWPELQNTSSPKCRRRSLSSECSVDSEDSFIVFQSGAPSDSSSDLASDWSDCDSDDSYESDDDSSDEVCILNFISYNFQFELILFYFIGIII